LRRHSAAVFLNGGWPPKNGKGGNHKNRSSPALYQRQKASLLLNFCLLARGRFGGGGGKKWGKPPFSHPASLRLPQEVKENRPRIFARVPSKEEEGEDGKGRVSLSSSVQILQCCLPAQAEKMGHSRRGIGGEGHLYHQTLVSAETSRQHRFSGLGSMRRGSGNK